MQWGAIAPSSIVHTRGGQAGVSPPNDGEITLEMAQVLLNILVRNSGEEEVCICAFWEGFNLLGRVPDRIRVQGIGQQHHVLFSSSLGAVRDQWCLVLRHAREPRGLTPQAVWPVSRDWYLAVPFDLQSCYVGGSVRLTKEIRSADSLETFEAQTGDSLWHDGLNNAGR